MFVEHVNMKVEENRSAAIKASTWRWVLGLGFLITVVLAVLLRPAEHQPKGVLANEDGTRAITSASIKPANPTPVMSPASTVRPLPASEIVAAKLRQFAHRRRDLTYAMAEKFKVEVPQGVHQFFDLLEQGDWEQAQAAFQSLSNLAMSADAPEGLHERIWPPIAEAYGVAHTAQSWPPQQLLDYGQAILGSLKPGMVYVGGTDAGRFIPTLLGETSDGERPIILTQNALADRTYLNYVSYLYGERLASPSEDDSSRAFSEYIADAQKRFTHDQQLPDEPKQVRPGEDIQMADGRTTVSGQVAVMTINEHLLRNIIDKNPGLSFALEESFPFKSTYASAVPLGPIMELRAADAQAAYTPETATQALDYWRNAADELAASTEAAGDSAPRREYSKMALAQANLLLEHNYSTQAEQALQIASEMCPSSPEVVFNYVNLLLKQNRIEEARAVVQSGLSAAPDNQQFKALQSSLATLKR